MSVMLEVKCPKLWKINICTIHKLLYDLSRFMRKPAFCICENKGADQLCGNRTADQCLCFRYIGSTIPLLPKSEISSLYPSTVVVQPSLCQSRSETQKTGFLMTRFISLQLVERQQMKLEEQKEENVEITQELRLTRYSKIHKFASYRCR